jgi:coenzyme F420 hydrogenase subunit beta
MKGNALREEMNDIVEAPRKTWFWELAAGVIDADRCIQCGTCVAVCPSNSIGVNDLTNLPELVKMCTGCSLCWDFCPRAGLRYEATWPPATPPADAQPVSLITKPDASDPYWKLTGVDPAADLGRVLSSHSVRSAKRNDDAQDGGAVTALLIALLTTGAIDGALVSKPSSNPLTPWKGEATIATTPAEVRAASGSFYNQTMALAELDLTKYKLPAKPRIALVGTPCEVEGLRAMQSRRWPTGNHRVDAVVLTIGLLCTKSFDYEKLILQELERQRDIDLRRVAKVDVTRGRLIVEYVDGAVALDEPIKDFHGAALKGCDECADFLGRAADISVGSVGSSDGWTSVLIRSERGLLAFDQVRSAFDIRDLGDPEALLRLDALDKKIAMRSLERPFDTEGSFFIEFEEHVKNYTHTERTPVYLRSSKENTSAQFRRTITGAREATSSLNPS